MAFREAVEDGFDPQLDDSAALAAFDGASAEPFAAPPSPRTKRATVLRLVRYSAVSVIALAISELTLLGLVGTSTTSTETATVVAFLAGTIPSYLLSRYWIWSEADRRRPARQVVLYWLTSLISLGVSTGVTDAASDAAPRTHVLRLVVIGAAYLGISLVLWVAKYLTYHFVVFGDRRHAAPVDGFAIRQVGTRRNESRKSDPRRLDVNDPAGPGTSL